MGNTGYCEVPQGGKGESVPVNTMKAYRGIRGTAPPILTWATVCIVVVVLCVLLSYVYLLYYVCIGVFFFRL